LVLTNEEAARSSLGIPAFPTPLHLPPLTLRIAVGVKPTERFTLDELREVGAAVWPDVRRVSE
jgi:hypothetical protein